MQSAFCTADDYLHVALSVQHTVTVLILNTETDLMNESFHGSNKPNKKKMLSFTVTECHIYAAAKCI